MLIFMNPSDQDMSDVRTRRSSRDSSSRRRSKSIAKPRNGYISKSSKRSLSRSLSRSYKIRSKSDNIDSKGIDLELQAFAQQHDCDALFEKLKESRLNKLRQSVDESKTEQQRLLMELAKYSSDNSMGEIRTGDEKENSESENVELTKITNGQALEASNIAETVDPDSPSTSFENIEDEYPWYFGAPIQSQIYFSVYDENAEIEIYNGRPQKEVEDDGTIRTFPVKKRDFVEFNVKKTKVVPSNHDLNGSAQRKNNGNVCFHLLKIQNSYFVYGILIKF